MRYKATLLLTELLVMLLVFAVAAALCLRVVAGAQVLSGRTERQDEAVLLARNTAELLKATGGDMEKARALAGGGYRLVIEERQSACPGLGQAEIAVYSGEDCLIRLETGWQEEIP